MNYRFRNVRRFQEGGAVGGDPTQLILEAAAQAVQSGDGNMALQVCAALIQMVQGGQGGPPPEAEGAPEGAPEGEPVFRIGGKLIKRI